MLYIFAVYKSLIFSVMFYQLSLFFGGNKVKSLYKQNIKKFVLKKLGVYIYLVAFLKLMLSNGVYNP